MDFIAIVVLIFLILLFCFFIFSSISKNSSSKLKTEELKKEQYEENYKKLSIQLEDYYSQKEKVLSDEYNKKLLKLKEQEKALTNEYDKKLLELEEKIAYQRKSIQDFDKIIIEKCQYYPKLAAIMSDLLTLYYERSARYLETKPHPAFNEAMRIRELRADAQTILAQKKKLEYELAYIRELFPNIDDIFDSGFNAENFELETEETTDRTRLFLSSEEFANLSITERNQLALSRYILSRKSKWELGRDFELYIGYCCEEQGWQVEYTGILKKLEDLGRDLIIKKSNKTIIIQCKNWSKTKTIHEKHIFQLYGTIVLYKLNNPLEIVEGAFISTTQFSNIAKKVGKHLNIKLINEEMREFPRIKCNINKSNGEKIYHLPFDQQYEKTIISRDKGEFYALSVKEAEAKGFRRAFKYKCE